MTCTYPLHGLFLIAFFFSPRSPGDGEFWSEFGRFMIQTMVSVDKVSASCSVRVIPSLIFNFSGGPSSWAQVLP